jgi:hypothetical protein
MARRSRPACRDVLNRAWRLFAAAALCAIAVVGQAAPSTSLRLCDGTTQMTARQQDRMLRFAAIVKHELDESGRELALISRNGTDLHRFGLRYSHAGISLKASGNGPWSVRQLYYACDEQRPRLYDQGLAGFLFGTDNPDAGYVSIVMIPSEQAGVIEQAAMDNARALRLLASTYSANAYAFSVEYQNCNQWVMELLAAAWAPLTDGDDLRARAQEWLAVNGYDPTPVEIGSHLLMFAAPFIPMIHLDDHPLDDRFALRLRVSLPTTIEAFVRERMPGAQRIEMCFDARQAVVHRGWDDIAPGCVPRIGDAVIAFD